MPKKSLQDFQNYLIIYRKALLDLVPIYYEKGYDPMAILLNRGTINKCEEALESEKSKEERELLSKNLSISRKELKEAKAFENKELIPIRNKLQGVIGKLDEISKEHTIRKFRYKLSSIDHNDNNDLQKDQSVQEMSNHIILDFEEYIYELQNNNSGQGSAEDKIIEKMDVQEGIYFQENHSKLPDRSKQEKLSGDGVDNAETVAYDWRISKRDVYCNEQHIVKLPNLQFELFKCLYDKSGKYVKNQTLEKCWGGNLPNYTAFLSDAMGGLNTNLEKGLKEHHIEIKSRLIEPKQEHKKNVAYKLVT